MPQENHKHLFIAARMEILQLRRTNEVLQAKVDTMDTLTAFLFARVQERSQGMTVDVAWELQREIDAFDAVKEPGTSRL
jgi:hypothetical protein